MIDGVQLTQLLSHETIEQALIGMFWLDESGRIVRANPASTLITGYPKDELLELRIDEVDPFVDQARLKEIWKTISKHESIIFESEIQQKSGGRIPVEVRINLISSDATKHICGFFWDISQRKKVEDKLRLHEKLISSVINNHFQFTGMLDLDGRLIMANQTALNKLNLRHEEVLGKFIWEGPWFVATPESAEQMKEGFLRSLKGEFVRFETRHLDLNGNEYYLDQSLTPIFDDAGKLMHVIPEAREITEIKLKRQELETALHEVEELKSRLEAEKVYLQEEIRADHNFGEMIGQSRAFRKMLNEVERVASTNANVLILGETGTGKELVARAVHNLSDREERTLLKVNCAALPHNLIESELFGHEKGAFTGAYARKIGHFELADGGTIFLDEIGDLPLELQSKLLRIIQEGELQRVGSSETLNVDVRLITATNRDLDSMVISKTFREDLYYRLNVFPIHCPSLRERQEDIPVLIKHFIKKYNRRHGKQIERISDKTLKKLQQFTWPGNIRELENYVERSIIISDGKTFEYIDLRSEIKTAPGNENGGVWQSLDNMQVDYIKKVLHKTSGRIRGKGGAAQILGVIPTTLESRIKKLGIRS